MDGPGVHKRIDSGLMDIVVQDEIVRILRDRFALSVTVNVKHSITKSRQNLIYVPYLSCAIQKVIFHISND